MMSARNTIATTLLAAGAPLWLMLAAAGPALAGGATCPPLASKAVTSTTSVSTTSTSYVNVSGTGVNFVQGGTRPGCVVVLFTAEARADTNELMTVRALLDGTTACQAPDIRLARNEAFESRAANFLCAGVAPGSHSIKIQYFSAFGGTVALDYRTTIVQYVP